MPVCTTKNFNLCDYQTCISCNLNHLNLTHFWQYFEILSLSVNWGYLARWELQHLTLCWYKILNFAAPVVALLGVAIHACHVISWIFINFDFLFLLLFVCSLYLCEEQIYHPITSVSDWNTCYTFYTVYLLDPVCISGQKKKQVMVEKN